MLFRKLFIGARKVYFSFLYIIFFLVAASCTNGSDQNNKSPIFPEIVQSSPTPIQDTFITSTLGAVIIPMASSTLEISLSELVINPTSTIVVINQSPTPSKTSTPSKIPSRTKAPTKTRVPTRTPKPTPIPPTPIPQDNPIKIFIPASYSKITTPFNLVVAVIPGSGGNVHMQLTGENNRKILEKSWIFHYANGRRTTIDENFDISISGVAEAARLSIYTLDENGRIIALSSEDILLLSIGDGDIAEALDLMEPFSLRAPYPGNSIRNGVVEVRGITRTRTASTIYFELVDQSGKVVGSYVSENAIQPSLEYQSLNIDLSYKVSKATWVRLIMHQVDIRNGKDVAVSSIILKLYP
jgi:hypothetical protein